MKGIRSIIVNAALGALCAGLSACNVYDDPGDGGSSSGEGYFSNVDATSYTDWVYIDLRGGTSEKLGMEAEAPAEWDFAMHRYDCKTNGGSVFETGYTVLDDAVEAWKAGTFDDVSWVADVWSTDKIIVDMSGMMDGNIEYAETYYNAEFTKWLDLDLSVMPPVYTPSDKVYLLKTAAGEVAAVRFGNYMNDAGVKGYISFEYVFPL